MICLAVWSSFSENGRSTNKQQLKQKQGAVEGGDRNVRIKEE